MLDYFTEIRISRFPVRHQDRARNLYQASQEIEYGGAWIAAGMVWLLFVGFIIVQAINFLGKNWLNNPDNEGVIFGAIGFSIFFYFVLLVLYEKLISRPLRNDARKALWDILQVNPGCDETLRMMYQYHDKATAEKIIHEVELALSQELMTQDRYAPEI